MKVLFVVAEGLDINMKILYISAVIGLILYGNVIIKTNTVCHIPSDFVSTNSLKGRKSYFFSEIMEEDNVWKLKIKSTLSSVVNF